MTAGDARTRVVARLKCAVLEEGEKTSAKRKYPTAPYTRISYAIKDD